MYLSDEEINADVVARDVTVVLSRIGQWRAESKPKYIHFSHHIDEQQDTRFYTVGAF